MRHYLSILFFLISFTAVARIPDYNSEEVWRRLIYTTHVSAEEVSKADTVIIVVSNRSMRKDSLRFMDEYRDGKQLNYFVVYASKNKWHVFPVKNLSDALQYMKPRNRDWVVYTEGMGKIFTSALDRGMRLSATYDVNVIMFDYPSISTTYSKIRNYYFAIGNARNAYIDFLPVLDTIKQLRLQQQLGDKHLSLFFHSMGNNVMKEIVENKKLNEINDAVWADNIILNAPCVPQRQHSKWLQQISFSKNIYVHYNPDDYVLRAARIISLKRQLGCTVKNGCENVKYINFNPIVGKGHSNFLSLPGRVPARTAVHIHYNRLFHEGEVKLEKDTMYRMSSSINWELIPQLK